MKTLGRLPLDSLHWQPLARAFERRYDQTRDERLAAYDLLTKLKDGDLPCMRRTLVWQGAALVEKRELLGEESFSGWPTDAIVIVAQGLYGVRDPLFVWWPYVTEFWPDIEDVMEDAEPVSDAAASAVKQRAKPKPSGPKAWALDQLRGLIKHGDPKPQQTLLRRWEKKFGRFRDRETRERHQRKFRRWRDAIIEENRSKKPAT
jgi:hypothetical protein